MNWQDVETLTNDAAQELLDWANEKSTQECSLPEECCGKCGKN